MHIIKAKVFKLTESSFAIQHFTTIHNLTLSLKTTSKLQKSQTYFLSNFTIEKKIKFKLKVTCLKSQQLFGLPLNDSDDSDTIEFNEAFLIDPCDYLVNQTNK